MHFIHGNIKNTFFFFFFTKLLLCINVTEEDIKLCKLQKKRQTAAATVRQELPLVRTEERFMEDY